MKTKSAYTIIELVISIAISSIIISVSSKVITLAIVDYMNNVDSEIENDNLDNCLINIDNLLRSNYVVTIEGVDNKIIIVTKLGHGITGTKTKIIALKDNNLIVRTFKDTTEEVTTGNNVLLKGVDEFEVLRKDNLVYYSITTVKGVTRRRCI